MCGWDSGERKSDEREEGIDGDEGMGNYTMAR